MLQWSFGQRQFMLLMLGTVSWLVAATLTAAILSMPGGPLQVVVGFSEPTEVVLGGELIADAPSITYPTSAAPTLARGALLTVAGRSWRVRTVERLADGGESRATLEKA